MPVATPAEVRKQIASGAVAPVYLLQGEDEVEKSGLAHEFEELVEEGLRAFNVERVHAGDATSGDRMISAVLSIAAAVRTLPMMAPRRVVLVLQADGLLAPKRESDAAERAWEELEALLTRPETQTALVFVAGPLDKRSRVFRQFSKHATLVECGAIESQADAERWIRNRVTAAGLQVDPQGARLMAERAGTDVKRLRNETDRLLLYAFGQKTITLDDVREVIGPMTLQDDWAMTNAIEQGDAALALRQLALMLEAGSRWEQILGQLGWLVRTKFPMIAAEHLRTAIDALFRTDLALKRSAAEPRMLLERLVVELCGGKRRRPSGRF